MSEPSQLLDRGGSVSDLGDGEGSSRRQISDGGEQRGLQQAVDVDRVEDATTTERERLDWDPPQPCTTASTIACSDRTVALLPHATAAAVNPAP